MVKVKAFIQYCLNSMMVLYCIYLGYLIAISPSGLRLYRQLTLLKLEEAQKLENTLQKSEQLKKKTMLLQEDKQYQSSEARVVWGLVKPDEQIIWYHQLEKE